MYKNITFIVAATCLAMLNEPGPLVLTEIINIWVFYSDGLIIAYNQKSFGLGRWTDDQAQS